MHALSSTPTASHDIAGRSWTSGLAATLQRWWAAYLAWRSEQAAIAELAGMSDRELQDIGVCRCGIEYAVMEKLTRGSAFHRTTAVRSRLEGVRP